jgi:DNA-binding IclR family transcriptional regulator
LAAYIISYLKQIFFKYEKFKANRLTISAKNIIPGADKLLSIMEELAKSPQSLQELAARCEASNTTCYRAVQTLLSHGWIYRCGNGRYDISASFGQLAARSDFLKLKRLQPLLEELARHSGLAAKVSIREGESQLACLRADAPGPFGISLKTGSRFPVVEGTVGAALLCATPLAEIRSLCGKCGADLEESDAALVARRIRTIREKGWLFSGKTTRWGIQAMSAPLRRGRSVFAALTLIGMPGSFRNQAELAATLLETAVKMEELS